MRVTFFRPQYEYGGYGVSAKKLIKYSRQVGLILDEPEKHQNDIGICYHLPKYLDKLNTKYKVLFTMIESDDVPREWLPYMRKADMLIAPSRFVQKLFGKKLNRKVEYVPLGVDPDAYYYVERPKERPFTFISYDTFSKRKGFWELMTAWQQAFGNRGDNMGVQLILKSANKGAIPPVAYYKNVKVLQEKLNERQMLLLLQRADCLVFPSWGEGFGCPPLEALATGIPVICPNTRGIKTYFNKKYMLATKTGSIPAVYDHIEQRPIGHYRPNTPKSIAKRMLEVYNNRGYWRSMGKEMSAWAHTWSYEQSAAKLKKVLNKLTKKR